VRLTSPVSPAARRVVVRRVVVRRVVVRRGSMVLMRIFA